MHFGCAECPIGVQSGLWECRVASGSALWQWLLEMPLGSAEWYAVYQVAQDLGHFQGSQAPHAQLALVGQKASVAVHQHCPYGISPIH